MQEFLIEKIKKLAEPFLEEAGVILVDLNIRRDSGAGLVIQILTDKPRGGITLAECSSLNRRIGDAIEKESLINGRYVLEVSSPGLDRPLRTEQDFLRVIDREVRVLLSEAVENKVEYTGIVRRVENDSVVIEEDFIEHVLPITKINKAVQVI